MICRAVKSSQLDAYKMITVLGPAVTLDRNNIQYS